MDPMVLRSSAPWKHALGPLDDVEPALRGAFTDAQGYLLLPPPGPNGWRRQRPEAPQSVADFRADHPNARVAPRDRLALLPLGRFPLEVVADGQFIGPVRAPELPAIAAVLAAFFATPVDTLPALAFPAAHINRRIRDGRSQYDARDLLDRADRRLPADAHGMLLLVNVDLFVFSDQDYAYGWSTLHNRLAVVGFSRLDPGPHAPFAGAGTPGPLLRRGLFGCIGPEHERGPTQDDADEDQVERPEERHADLGEGRREARVEQHDEEEQPDVRRRTEGAESARARAGSHRSKPSRRASGTLSSTWVKRTRC